MILNYQLDRMYIYILLMKMDTPSLETPSPTTSNSNCKCWMYADGGKCSFCYIYTNVTMDVPICTVRKEDTSEDIRFNYK
jgi:hypothetical protein